MFSEALLTADRNTVNLMIDEMRQELNELSATLSEKYAELSEKDAEIQRLKDIIQRHSYGKSTL